MGPAVPICDQIHAEKYRGQNETFRECTNRIANALKDDESHYKNFREILSDMRFLPGGRIQSAMGSPRAVTPYNCFVLPTIDDSMVDGDNSITRVFEKAVATMRKGGGVGYNFGTLRPRGDLIRKLDSTSCGPVPMMNIFDAGCLTISSSGHRRGAQMGVLPIWHPDIEEFIRAKHPPPEAEPILELLKDAQDEDEYNRYYSALQAMMPLTGFNISVGITDDFMMALCGDDEEYPLRFNGKTYKYVNPKYLWELLMRSTWDYADPGVLFLDTINNQNNLSYCETIHATNPCGEQPLPPNGACLLGSFNLVKYLFKRSDNTYYFSFDKFKADIPIVVRAMDNVIDRASYPLREQELEAQSKRRMGLGVTGLANCLETMGLAYGRWDFVNFQQKILSTLTHYCYKTSCELAKEKGSFKLFDRDKYSNGWFTQNVLNDEIKDMIWLDGIRNSHLTSIAPTGTISFTADYVSSGVEPVFSVYSKRLIRTDDGHKEVVVEDYAHKNFGTLPRTSEHVNIDEHLSVLICASQNVDSAVSKTLNVPNDTPWNDFCKIYRQAWGSGAKGCTTFTMGGLKSGILTKATKEENACYVDPITGQKNCE